MKISANLRKHTKIASVSSRLKELMKSKNLRQIDILNLAKPFCVANGVKLEKNDLSQYVSGKVEPKDEKLHILSLALSVTELWLKGYDVPMTTRAEYLGDEENPYEEEISEALESMPLETQIPFSYFARVCAMNPYKAKNFLEQLPLDEGLGSLPDQKEAPTLTEKDRRSGIEKNMNILRIAGRDGSFEERVLTDEQMATVKAFLNLLPDASDDL